MRKFEAKFYGRKKGTIGIRYLIVKNIEADSFDFARLALYDDYEHISDLEIKEIKHDLQELGGCQETSLR